VTPDPGVFFHIFLTPGLKEKHIIMLESAQALWIHGHLCCLLCKKLRANVTSQRGLSRRLHGF